MKRRCFAAVAVAIWGAALFLTEACSHEESSAPSADQPPAMTGENLVRGMMGLPLDPSQEPNDAKSARYEAVARDLIAEIDAEFPGRLAQIEADLKSRDPQRVQGAKAQLDQSIATAASSASLLGRLEIDPALAGMAFPSATGNKVRVQDGIVNGDAGSVVGDGGPLVGDAGPLVCEQPRGADGNPIHLGNVNGRYGDDRTGASGALADTQDLVDTTDLLLWRTLGRIDRGELTPDPESRLGAYAATRGYSVGTVGNAVHNAIGTIYLTFANYGQERIGRVFNSPQARALYDQPVDSCAGAQMAMLEYQYWTDVTAEDSYSPGGHMGSMFNPSARDLLQRYVFNR